MKRSKNRCSEWPTTLPQRQKPYCSKQTCSKGNSEGPPSTDRLLTVTHKKAENPDYHERTERRK